MNLLNTNAKLITRGGSGGGGSGTDPLTMEAGNLGLTASTSLDTNGNATKGTIVVPTTNIDLYRASFKIDPSGAGQTYNVTIAEFDGTQVTAVLYVSPDHVAPNGDVQWLDIQFDEKVSLSSGVQYIIACSRTDATGTTALFAVRAGSAAEIFPVTVGNGTINTVRFSSTALNVNDVPAATDNTTIYATLLAYIAV